jgi:integrase
VNRLLNDLRAALNAAAETHRLEMPAHLPAEIKAGTKAISFTGEPRRQLLSDAEVRRTVDAAFGIDADGDFGRLVMLAAATGARYSQLAALRVGDVQVANARVMMPASKKGRARRFRPATAVPLADDVIAKLLPILQGRRAHEHLLLRWAYRSVGPLVWEKAHRRPWGPGYETKKPWAAAAQRAGLAVGTIMYALRHSSIVRHLRAGLPVRLVAALHDTSTEMIEAHYSAFIVDMTEDLARKAAMSLGGLTPQNAMAAE